MLIIAPPVESPELFEREGLAHRLVVLALNNGDEWKAIDSSPLPRAADKERDKFFKALKGNLGKSEAEIWVIIREGAA
jgi:hypothetical protein